MSEYHEQIIGRLYLDIKELEEDCERYIKRSEELMSVHDELQSLKQKYADLHRKHENAQKSIALMREQIRGASKGEQQGGNEQADGVE